MSVTLAAGEADLAGELARAVGGGIAPIGFTVAISSMSATAQKLSKQIFISSLMPQVAGTLLRTAASGRTFGDRIPKVSERERFEKNAVSIKYPALSSQQRSAPAGHNYDWCCRRGALHGSRHAAMLRRICILSPRLRISPTTGFAYLGENLDAERP